MEAFAAEGLSVPVAELARRAGVGTGTVSRHFPMKVVGGIVDRARDLSVKNDPGSAFFQFLAHMVEQAAVNRGLAEAICGAGFDVETVVFRPEHSLEAVESELLTRAQQASAVRRDITRADVKALLVGCLARERQGWDPEARQCVIGVVCTGLRAEPGTPVCDDRGLAG